MMDIDAFAQKHGLDDSAVAELENLDPDLLQEVFANFRSAGSDNVSARLCSFVRNMTPGRRQTKKDLPKAKTFRTNLEIGPLSNRENVELARFIRKYDLDAEASATLLELPNDARSVAVEDFEPRSNTGNISKLFVSFALSLCKTRLAPAVRQNTGGRKRRFDHTCSIFIEDFGLDNECALALNKLPDDVAQTVMQEFNPTRNTKNVNRLFMTFAKNIKEIAESKNPRDSNEARYAGKWAKDVGLDSKATDLLFSLTDEAKSDVMDNFRPPANANVNKIFMSFANKQKKKETIGAPIEALVD